MLEFSHKYMFKQNTDIKRVYMSTKKDWGINMVLS